MAASVFDSPLFSRLFPSGEAGRLFTDTAEVRAMLLVQGTLAKVQGELDIIPEDSGFFIHRSSMEIQIDPAALADETGRNGVSVPGLVAAFRKAMEAPEHSQFIHWGATSQDIIDTGLMLRLRQLLALAEKDLRAILTSLAVLAQTHATTPMAARTWGQHATLTSFGAQVAEWGTPLIDLLEELPALRKGSLWVSLSGAAGTSGALGPKATETRAALAKALGLHDPARSWHVDRGPILRIAAWLTRVNTVLGKFGADLVAMVQTGVAEVSLGSAGASSTMPQKQNPVAPSALVALARQSSGFMANLQDSALQTHQRDPAAWFTEWLALPQLCLGAASALTIARAQSASLAPRLEVMRAAATDPLGLIHAEALSFALASKMRRPQAQATTKTLCQEAVETGASLQSLASRAHPDIDFSAVFEPAAQLGQAPNLATDFAKRVAQLD